MKRTSALFLSLAAGFTVNAQTHEPLRIALEPVERENPILCRAPVDGPVIQLAICLDTSGSMEGLINQARTRIWSVVNKLDDAEMNGVKPRLEIALYQYGSDLQSGGEGFMACVLPFTSDLDRISEALFGLQVNGSAEYCGMAIDRATQELAWLPKNDETLKVIVIAGNEHFQQGPIDYTVSVPAALEYGITINTVHCGSDSEGRAGGWKDAAHIGRGEYNFIDHNRDYIEIECPQDVRLLELNVHLNGTYMYYGREGHESRMRQGYADSSNAAASPAAMQQRIQSKASDSYNNSSWDLVDAAAEEDFELAELEREVLPAELQDLSDEELQAKIDEYSTKRGEIQAEITKLSSERATWLAVEMTRLGESDENSLDHALVGALVTQAKAIGYTFTEE